MTIIHILYCHVAVVSLSSHSLRDGHSAKQVPPADCTIATRSHDSECSGVDPHCRIVLHILGLACQCSARLETQQPED